MIASHRTLSLPAPRLVHACRPSRGPRPGLVGLVGLVALSFVAALGACGGSVSATPGSAEAGADDAALGADGGDGGVLPSACTARALVVREALPASANANPLDPLGYLPFAEDGCGLLYVSGQDRRLTRVAFDTGEHTQVDTLSRAARPSARDGLAAWEAVDAAGRVVVRVRVGDGAPFTLPGAYTKAFEPRVGVDAVVYTFTRDDPESEAADLDVAVFTPSTRTVTVVGEGPGQQRFGALAKGRVAFADFAEDPSGAFSSTEVRAADVVVVDLASGARTVRNAAGEQVFPQLSDDGLLVYLDLGEAPPEPKLGAYRVLLGRADDPSAADRVVHTPATLDAKTPWLQPSLRDGFVAWIEDDTTLLRRAVALDATPVVVATHSAGLVGVAQGGLAVYVAARSPTAPSQVFVESRTMP